jgi:hypothetical protein
MGSTLVHILDAWVSNLIKQTDIIVLKSTSVEAGLYRVLHLSCNKAETALFNKRQNVCCSCSFLACDTAYSVEQTNISVTEIYVVSIFRVERHAKK